MTSSVEPPRAESDHAENQSSRHAYTNAASELADNLSEPSGLSRACIRAELAGKQGE